MEKNKKTFMQNVQACYILNPKTPPKDLKPAYWKGPCIGYHFICNNLWPGITIIHSITIFAPFPPPYLGHSPGFLMLHVTKHIK